ncbi:hypothetical protein G7076_02880 [Sphingomonas sp. HDW15A]|uniref:hypothetical protein n=1 Tax=Sphingomonas sp. HDW15A TaxID=2714942 RepID=UPI00140E6AC9|nr:hypothetical protein [Sphingomonas sp. HDW15A]QIK95562.1 hypothetical protein G7076_02880 [Sphingomonas sp. HDW15A]
MRCKSHAPRKAIRNYVWAVEPVGYPATALVCGSVHCMEPAFIWLEEEEARQFDAGERVFRAFTATMKVRAA